MRELPGSSSTVPAVVGGRYELRDELGRGGMASVHRAHDGVLDREVAVKILHPHLAVDPAFLDRFRREARAAAALNHPNVVAVHDWGETDQGAYLVLGLVVGPSLRAVLRRRGRLSPAEALAVLGPAAAGLGAAHAAGLVHRDVKPENLLLDRAGTVQITDFGLARAAASATSTFGAGVLVGSPHYLSPEAVRGEPLDARADVYGLGVVLFECLTGRPPHQGDSPYATAVAHTSTPVPPPSELIAGVPETLDEVVLDATAREASHRQPDAEAFHRALRAAVPGGPAALATLLEVSETTDRHPVGPPPPPPPPPPRVGGDTVVDTGPAPTTTVGPRRRRRSVAPLVVLALLAACALGGYLLYDRVIAPVVAVPEVLDAAQQQAVDRLETAGFRVEATRVHDETVPEGRILATDPAPGTELPRGGSVEVEVSDGPEPVEVPGVDGKLVDEARATLIEAGFEVEVERRGGFGALFNPDRVFDQDPAPRTERDPGTTVTLFAYDP